MERKHVLRELRLGNSVAEYDDALERFFVETAPFRELLAGNVDIVAGDKGTGKTAIFKILCGRYRTYPALDNVEVLPAVNPLGNPVFERLIVEGSPFTEGQYITIWKSYIVSLVGNYILDVYEDHFGANMTRLDELLRRTELRSVETSANTIFNVVANLARRLTRPQSVEGAVTLTPHGLPLVAGRMTFGPNSDDRESLPYVPHDEAFALLEAVLEESGVDIWLAFDRLDEAFQAAPLIEKPALRALLRTQLDLANLSHVRLKLFVRRDLFRRIIEGGFVNLTHINARKTEIVWEDADLIHLLGRRLADSASLVTALGLVEPSPEELFDTIFPVKVDMAERKPTTRNWMVSRIRDGNGIKPPRNLLDLVLQAREADIRREDRAPTDFVTGEPLIRGESLKRGLEALSKERVEDTLLAEAPDLAPIIERFRGGKAEHTIASLADTIGVAEAEVAADVKALEEIGFLEAVGPTYKIPMLYRSGLAITQGKAFSDDNESDSLEE